MHAPDTAPTTLLPAGYCELHAHSNFSFLDGASHPEELVARAAGLAPVTPIIGLELTIPRNEDELRLARRGRPNEQQGQRGGHHRYHGQDGPAHASDSED